MRESVCVYLCVRKREREREGERCMEGGREGEMELGIEKETGWEGERQGEETV